MEKKEKTRAIDRRGFLRTAAIAAGAATTGSLAMVSLTACSTESSADGTADEKTVVVGDPAGCTGRCILEATVRDGKLCRMKNRTLVNDRKRENICQRGLSHVYAMYDEHRILYPMRRVGERGSNQFERISWDEAIEEICTKWKGYIDEYGGSSLGVFGGSGGQGDDSGSAFSAPKNGYVSLMTTYLNMNKIICDFDSAGLEFYGAMLGGGASACGNDWCDLPHADHIVCWASNPIEGMVGRYHNVTDAQRAGATLTVIDPNVTSTAVKADTFVPIRPGTDGLLAIAMMRKVLDAGLQDEDFLREKSVAPFLVKDSDGMYLTASDLGMAQAGAKDDLPLALEQEGTPVVAKSAQRPLLHFSGAVGGITCTTAYDLLVERIRSIEYTNDEIYALTEVPEETVDMLVGQFTDGATSVITVFGADHYSNGHTFYTCMLTLIMLTGNLGKHGAGIVGAGTAFFIAPVGGDITDLVNPTGPGLGCAHEIHGSSVRNVIRTGKYGDDDVNLKSIYVQGSNVLHSQAGRREWIEELLPKIDFVVVADMVYNDTTRYADLVLPVCYWFEAERYWTSEGYIIHSGKVQEPLGESMGDLEIINRIMEGMGYGDACMTRDEFFTKALDNKGCNALGITWDRVKKEETIKTVPDGYVDVLGLDRDTISTAEGRFSFYFNGRKPIPDIPEENAKWDYDRERMLYWEPPHEAWSETDYAKRYPVQLLSKRAKYKAHTGYTYCENLLELSSEPYVAVNPDDALARGIGDGDYVRVFNDRGDMTCQAYLSAGMRPGIIQIEHGWMGEQFKEGHYSDLTSSFTRNVVGNNCWSDTMVEFEKVDVNAVVGSSENAVQTQDRITVEA